MSKYVIGVDIGGTKIAAGIVSLEGILKTKVVVPTLAKEGIKVSLKQVYKAIDNLISSSDIKMKDILGIGVCAPGPLDPVKGVVHNPPNLYGWKEVPLVKLLKEKYKKKVMLENDANASGMAENIWGAAKKYKHVFYVTVSTGIGTAIIIDGKIYHGKNGMAGEGGHVTISYNDKEKCNCGNLGCIETLASGPSTVKRLIEELSKNPKKRTSLSKMHQGKLNKLTMIDIGKAAKSGDKVSLKAIKDEANFLGIWLGNMVSLLDPEIIVIGGGVSLLGNLLIKDIKQVVKKRTINIFADKTPIVQAKLKQDVGIYGAASIIF